MFYIIYRGDEFMGCSSEIYLTKSNIGREDWLKLIESVSKYNGYLKKWNIIVSLSNNQIRYFIKSKVSLPTIINNLGSFLIKNEETPNLKTKILTLPTIYNLESNIIELSNYYRIKKYTNLKYIKITFIKVSENKILSNAHFYFEKNNKLIKSKLFLTIPQNILSIDFNNNKNYTYKKVPKYLDISKILHILKSDKFNSNLLVDTFPYLEGNYYLNQYSIDFAKHSLILGASGTGKSKYISSFIKTLNDTSHNNYRVVMIDPHASIEKDIGGLGHTIDFRNIEDSINLFASTGSDIISTTELILELFKSLISDQYNSKLERVLRHSIYLLISNETFNFNTLKNLILDIAFRTNLINNSKQKVPSSVIDFFLTDFNDLKTKSYGEAISPIISFIDEMEMIPIFNENNITNNLKDEISNNFLTLFSLDRTMLGSRITKTISGLIMQQLFTLIQSNSFKEHIIFIIDEVAIIENPIICRFLSEARKYNLSLFLAGQYFNQISTQLKESILANIVNYYIFRVSRLDASLLSENLEIKIPFNEGKDQKEQKENKINLLSSLNNRECIIRISSNNILSPVFKARTLDFTSIPRIINNKKDKNLKKTECQKSNLNINIDDISLKDILKKTSSSRIEVIK